MDSDREDRNAEGRKNAGTGQGNDEENGETAADFLYFMMYSVFGWLYELFGGGRLPVGLFQPGNLVWTLLYHLRIWSAASAFYTDGTEEKADLCRKNSHYAVSRVPRNCRRDYSDGIDRQLSHGMADRRLDVGLPEILLRFSGQNRAEPESSFRRGRYDHSLSFSAFL